MSNYSFFIGSDVSKHVIDVTYTFDGNTIYLGQFQNSSSGFKHVIKNLKKLTDIPTKNWFFCFENTGQYSKPLLFWLINNEIPCREESALKISKSLGLRRGKDDKTDSKDICLYCFEKQNTIQESELPKPSIMLLKKLISRRSFLVSKRQSLKVSLPEQKMFLTKETYEIMNQGNEELLKAFDDEIKRIEKAIETLIDSDSEMSEKDKLARSVIGIGRVASSYLLATTQNFTVFDDARKFACYCGVAPFPNSSGIKRGKAKVNHMANKKMKAILSNCIAAALRCDTQISKYYDKKLKEGKHKGIVLNAIKNKLLHRVFAVVKRGTPYVKIMNYA